MCSGSMRARSSRPSSDATPACARPISRRRAPSIPIRNCSSAGRRPAPSGSRKASSRSDENGDTVLLGRGGSDTSASYFAAKLQARRLEIWTDVPGMFSANPRSVPTARLLRALEYDEAQEIASSGAKVLHPRCIMPVKQYGIPLYVYATQTPKLEGTVITTHGGNVAAQVKAVTIKKNITLISMETVGMWHSVGFLADAFAGVQAARLVDRPGVDLGDERHGVARSGCEHARQVDARCAGRRSRQAVPRRSDRPVRRGEPGRPQHPRDPASPRRSARAVRRAEDLSGHAGCERPEHHLRHRRRAGRSAGRASARDRDPQDDCRSRARSDVGRAVRRRGPRGGRCAAVVAGSSRRAARARSRARRRVRLRPRDAQDSCAVTQSAAGHRRRLLRDEGELASADPAGVLRARAWASSACRAARSSTSLRRSRASIASASCSRRISRRARNTNGRWSRGSG